MAAKSIATSRKCCFCGEELNGYGNNAWPASKDAGARCCDFCNWTKVLPARAKLSQEDHTRKESRQ